MSSPLHRLLVLLLPETLAEALIAWSRHFSLTESCRGLLGDVHAKYFLLVRRGLKIEGGQCYKPLPLIQGAEQLNPSDESSKAIIRDQFRNMAHKEAQNLKPVFVHNSACRPRIITLTYQRPSTTSGSNAIQLTVSIVSH